jgi:hypothetical protein
MTRWSDGPIFSVSPASVVDFFKLHHLLGGMRCFMSPFALIYNQMFALRRFFRQGVLPCQRLFTTLPLSALDPEATQPPFALVNWA